MKKKILKNNLIFKIMNKYIFIILAFLFVSTTYSQKKELKFAERNIKSEDYSAAKQNLQLAEKLIGQMDAKTTVKYHYLKGVANYANGDSNIEESSISEMDEIWDAIKRKNNI